MAIKVLSVEIGQGLTHVVEMDYQAKNPKVYNYFTFKTPEGVVSDGTITKSNAFTNALNMEKIKRNIKTNKIVYSVASSRIASREVLIPMCKDREIQNIVDANSSDYFPVDMTQYHLVYRKSGIVKGEEGEQIKLSLLAVPNEITKSYFKFSDAIRHTVRGMDYIGNSIFQATKGSLGKGVNVVVKIDASSSLITVVDNGASALQRSIPYGMGLAADVIYEYLEKKVEEQYEGIDDLEEEHEQVTFMDAVDMLTTRPCIASTFSSNTVEEEDAEDAEDAIAEIRPEVTNTFKYLIGNISRIIDYYVTRHDNVEVESITIIGLGSNLMGLATLMENELEKEVKTLSDITGATFMKKTGRSFRIGEYAAAIGAGIHTWNLVPEGMGIQKDLTESLLIPLVVGVSCVVISGGMYVFGQLNYSAQLNNNKKLENRITDLQPVLDVQSEYEKSVNDHNSIVQINDNTSNMNSKLYNILELLESTMPKSFKLESFSATNTEVIMSCTVVSKADATTAIMKLREIDAFSLISAPVFQEVEEDGKEKVKFNVTCTYSIEAVAE